MPKFTDKYRVEVLDPKLYTSSWGVPNLKERALHFEAFINERYAQGYEVKEIIPSMDSVGVTHWTFIFSKIETK